jgi:hypothetical protein
MVQSNGWRPLLDGERAQQAREAAASIGRAIDHALEEHPQPELEGGCAGLAVLASYLARAGNAEWEDVVDRQLDGALTLVEQGLGVGLELLPGLFGIGWASEHIASFSDGDEDDGNEGIDDFLLESLEGSAPFGNRLEHHTGAIGAGLYALERSSSPKAMRCVAHIVEMIDHSAERNGSQIRWRRPPDTLLPGQVPVYPDGMYDLGLGHGVPGIVAFLAAAHEAGIAKDRTRELIEGAVTWLSSQRLPTGGIGCFGYAGDEKDAGCARLGWCYGDVGVAMVMQRAADALGRADWAEEAVRLAHTASRRPLETTGVVDAGFCHGSAGIGHILNRLHQCSGDTELGAAARTWFERTLAMRHPSDGLGGYTFLVPRRDMEGLVRTPDRGLLNGALGVALALVAVSSSVEPAWDCLLFASPPRASRARHK